MDNLELYEKVRSVPAEAQKTIAGGRLKGMTDINPMWRIKTLTEQFGICGYGWKTEIVRSWLDTGAKGEIIANMQINLYVKYKGEWSEAIPGIGGSMAVVNESKGANTDDECYKKAYTDALSVACKALGIGADVYFAKDRTKYDVKEQSSKEQPKKEDPLDKLNRDELFVEVAGLEIDVDGLAKFFKVTSVDDLTDDQLREGIRIKRAHRK